MSIDAINNVVQNSGIGTGSFLIFYDFSSYSGDSLNKHAPSLSGANESYSGELFPKTQPSYDASTGTSGTLNFSGGWGGVNNYLNVANSENFYSEYFVQDDFTIVFKGSHLTNFDIGVEKSMPLNSKDVVFSNLDGENNCMSGWELGINSANKLYMNTFSQQQPLNFSYQGGCYGENIWSMRYSNKNVTLSRFEPFDNVLENESIGLYEPISNGGKWTIGSGKNINAVDPTLSSGQTSALSMDNFMYFTESLSDKALVDLSLGILGESEEVTVQSLVFSSGISGLLYTGQAVSGIGWESGVLSGYKTSSTGSVTINRATELSGLVEVSDAYFDRFAQVSGATTAYLNSPEWIYQTFLNTGVDFTGITGLDYSPTEIDLSGLVPVYYSSGVSGELSSGLDLSQTESGSYYLISETFYGTSAPNSSSINPNSFSYIGDGESGDYIDLNYGVTAFDSGIQTVNKSMSKRASSVFLGDGLFFDDTYDMDDTSLFVNGLSVRYGAVEIEEISQSRSITVSKTGTSIIINCTGFEILTGITSENHLIFDGRVVTVRTEKDFGVTGSDEVVLQYDFSSASDQSNLFGVADLFQYGSRSELTISDTGQYTGSPFYDIDPSGNQMFFNGQKIYSGINFNHSTSGFSPTGYITGLTGVYHSIPNFTGSSQRLVSGDGSFHDYNLYTGSYAPKSNVLFVNGVRKPQEEFIDHDISKDLISGVRISAKAGVQILSSSFEV